MAKYIVPPEMSFNEGVVISAGHDSSLKVFQLQNNEVRCELFTPKKECYCFDVIATHQVVAAGFNDGCVRFFSYQ